MLGDVLVQFFGPAQAQKARDLQSDCITRMSKMTSTASEGLGDHVISRSSLALIWVKHVKTIINHPFGNGWNPSHKNGDDWGMVQLAWLYPWPGGAAPGIGQKKTTFGMGFHEVLLWARRLREKAGTGERDAGDCRIYWENDLYGGKLAILQAMIQVDRRLSSHRICTRCLWFPWWQFVWGRYVREVWLIQWHTSRWTRTRHRAR